MNILYNIYCDESCHLEKDNQKVMVIGGIWCPKNEVKNISIKIRDIKENHGLSRNSFEIKWVKVSPAKKDFYADLIDYFFNNTNLHLRALLIPDKSVLDHERYNQTHEDFYYKMYFDMLKTILNPRDKYNIYLDIKDTRSEMKVKKLHEVLCNNMYDFSREIIVEVKQVRSHEIEILQLTDLLIGAISYRNRQLTSSETKLKLIELIKERSGYDLTRTTLYREDKVNLLRWYSRENSS